MSRMIDEPFRPFGVPPNATSYGQFYIGTSGDPEAGMLVNVFGGEIREGKIFTQVRWLAITCKNQLVLQVNVTRPRSQLVHASL